MEIERRKPGTLKTSSTNQEDTMNAHGKIQFLGGVADGDNLTGSCISLTISQGKRSTQLLIDCGLKQGGKNAFEKNQSILTHLNPTRLDHIILTHSHIDHIGLLPLLAKHGFAGRIICTESTAALLPVMLEDSAKIQMAEAKKPNNSEPNEQRGTDRLSLGNYDRKRQKRKAKNLDQAMALYNLEDVKAVCSCIKNGGYAYRSWIKLDKGVDLIFYGSGHVLGGAICALRIDNGQSEPIYLRFSGDLGRRDGIILPPPEFPAEPTNYWFIESTYGDRIHPPRDQEIIKLLSLIKTAVAKKQKIIIPSFALERAQEIIYLLSYYMSTGQIPAIPIYLDSPMSVKITNIFSQNWKIGLFNDQNRLNFNPFSTAENKFLKTIEDKAASAALASSPGPYIVVAASGTCDAGPIRKYLLAELSNPAAIICIVGYMPATSLGRKLKDGLPLVHMNGHELPVRAQVVSFESFSAHADSTFLTDYTQAVLANQSCLPPKIFINHGEERGATFLKSELLKKLPGNYSDKIKNIIIPKLWEEFTLF